MSGNFLKILGFMFGPKPTVRYHVDNILNKARRKLWTLRHVKKAGMKEEDMMKIFNTIIRPCLEYAVPTFGPMLTEEMKNELESIQKRACKIVFGWDSSYSELIASGRVESLEKRREKLILNFAHKCVKNPRFVSWFPERNYDGMNVELRARQKYEEKYARTERLKKSPIFHMRRALNEKIREEASL